MSGPDENDNYRDSREEYIYNEVTLDYNAGFQSAVAGLRQLQLLQVARKKSQRRSLYKDDDDGDNDSDGGGGDVPADRNSSRVAEAA